jgi:Rrf2 family protein
MAYLAKTDSATSAEIARSEAIPHKYLEGILTALKQSGLIRSERGKGGGYSLSKDGASVTALEIVSALEGEVVPVECVTHEGVCGHDGACKPRLLWSGLKKVVDEYLASITLADM